MKFQVLLDYILHLFLQSFFDKICFPLKNKVDYSINRFHSSKYYIRQLCSYQFLINKNNLDLHSQIFNSPLLFFHMLNIHFHFFYRTLKIHKHKNMNLSLKCLIFQQLLASNFWHRFIYLNQGLSKLDKQPSIHLPQKLQYFMYCIQICKE